MMGCLVARYNDRSRLWVRDALVCGSAGLRVCGSAGSLVYLFFGLGILWFDCSLTQACFDLSMRGDGLDDINSAPRCVWMLRSTNPVNRGHDKLVG